MKSLLFATKQLFENYFSVAIWITIAKPTPKKNFFLCEKIAHSFIEVVILDCKKGYKKANKKGFLATLFSKCLILIFGSESPKSNGQFSRNSRLD